MHDLSDEYVQVLIVGHNPGLEELVEILTGEIHLTSTCSLAHVNLRVDKWLERDYEIRGQLEEIWLRAISRKAILKNQLYILCLFICNFISMLNKINLEMDTSRHFRVETY